MAKDDDEIVLPKKSKTKSTAAGSGKGSPAPSGSASSSMKKLMRITCAIGIALGGFVTLVGIMGVVGLAVSNIWVRLVVAALIVIALPAVLADRMLKRSESTLATKGGIGMVANVFAIVLLGIALAMVGAEKMTSSLFAHEGDLHAKAGSMTMARLVYFLAGVSPVFPSEKALVVKPGASSSGSAGSSSASGATSAAAPR